MSKIGEPSASCAPDDSPSIGGGGGGGAAAASPERAFFSIRVQLYDKDSAIRSMWEGGTETNKAQAGTKRR